MFKRVRIRLVIMNTAVLSVVLILICGILYGFTRNQLFRQIDRDLHLAARPVEHAPSAQMFDFFREQTNGLPVNPRFGQLPTTYLVWSSQSRLVKQLPDGEFAPSETVLFSRSLNEKVSFTITVQNHLFRVMNVPITTADESPFQQAGTVQVIRNIDEPLRELEGLLWLLLIVTGMGLIMSAVAGLFLARRALIPILTSWNRQQTFVSDASHELRTPLAVIQAQAELLLRHPNHTVEQEASNVGTIYEEARRMSKLVESLLTLARADSNQAELSLATVSLSNTFGALTDVFTLLCDQKSLQLQLDIEPGVELRGDEDRLRQLVLILFDNAMKYTPEGGTISLSCRARGHAAEIEVADTGIGIQAEDLPHIFERFYRGDKARSRSNGGAGLGLAIAKWIVHAHQGKMTVTSAVGTGTTLYISIPTRL